MDGGYYAIKGFAYQIDKTILELLRAVSDDAPISVEHCQDISTDAYVMQIKYRATQDYCPSLVREPVLQLLEEFLRDPSREYILFCHFRNKKPERLRISRGELDTILTISAKARSDHAEKQRNRIAAIQGTQRNSFLEKFSIEYSEEFQIQFEEAIKALCSLRPQLQFEEALAHYSCVVSA